MISFKKIIIGEGMKRNLFEYHPIIGYRFIPEIKARVEHEGGGYLVKCNKSGFRSNHEFTKLKLKNVFRIILFGDSFTAGEGVSNKYRFSDLLEKKFQDIEILNFSPHSILPLTKSDEMPLR